MGLREYLKQLETRAGNIMQELRAMDDGQIDGTEEFDAGEFDNERWLSEELEEMGDQYDSLEDVLEELDDE